MQSAGSRNPQNVYDGGLKQLSDLERAGNAALDGMGNCYCDVTEKLETDARTRMEKRACEQEELVRTHVEGCIFRTRQSLQLECDRSEVQLKEIINKLMWAGRKYQLQVQNVATQTSECVKEYDENNTLRYTTAAEGAIAELDDQNLKASNQFQELVDNYRNGFYLESESGLSGLSTAAEEANTSLSQLFATEVEAIQTYQRNVDASLSATANRSIQAIKVEVKEQSDRLRRFVDEVIEGAQTRFIESGDTLHSVLESTLNDSASGFDKSVEDALSQLSNHQEAHLGELSSFARKRGEALAGFSDGQFQKVEGELRRVLERVEHKTTFLISSLQERLDRQTDMHVQIQVEKQRSLDTLLKSLEELWIGFEREISELSITTGRELSDACARVQSGIAQTQMSCLGEIEAQSDKQMHEIRSSQDDILRQIATLRQQALDGVRRACGGSVDFADAGGESASAEGGSLGAWSIE